MAATTKILFRLWNRGRAVVQFRSVRAGECRNNEISNSLAGAQSYSYNKFSSHLQKMPKNLGVILLEQKSISQTKLHYSFLSQMSKNKKLGEVMLEHGFLSQEDLVRALATQYYMDIISADKEQLEPYLIRQYNLTSLLDKGCMPVSAEENKLVIALKYSHIDNMPEILEELIINPGQEISVKLATYKEFEKLYAKLINSRASTNSLFRLPFINPGISAAVTSFARINFFAALLLLAAFSCFYATYFEFAVVLMGLYLVNHLNKLSLFFSGILKRLKDKNSSNLREEYKYQDDLPLYSILVPLKSENSITINKLCRAILRLKYPKDKLEVFLILEEGDSQTQGAIDKSPARAYFKQIIVPRFGPQTKPKAMNYALDYCSGKYLTVYDAEDMPEPGQLLKAVRNFEKFPEHYICQQARLNLYNSGKRLLSKLFSLEYEVWFGYLLKGLSYLDFPVTLGGTSNHFKTHRLKELGGWDSYNVTEDAELGLRLYRHGYRVNLFDSITYEEGPETVKNWYRQRTRWIKGFLITYSVFLANYLTKPSKFGFGGYIAVHSFLGIATISFLLTPITFVFLSYSYCLQEQFLLNHKILHLFWLLQLFGLLMNFLETIFANNASLFKPTRKSFEVLAIVVFPVYFLLHTIAAYQAIIEFVLSPYKWRKTSHGS
jgi:cellulose synthase/poly-beta-1,6-N-acetylglucosamine synthase-like glycosyltransferase